MQALARPAGEIEVFWDPPLQTTVKGYNVYRSNSTFSTVAQGEKLNTIPLASREFIDMPTFDENWYYGVTTVSTADIESRLSMMAFAPSDSTAPVANLITYSPAGPAGPGTVVNIELEVSEPCDSTPFLSLNIPGAAPINVSLSPVNDLLYRGFIVIAENTPSGTAQAVFSARDSG